MPKWVYPTAFVFLLFLIFTQPATAGSVAGEFAGFIGQMLRALGEFLSGLFGGATEGQSSGFGSEGIILEAPQTDAPHSTDGHTHDFSE